MLALSARGLLVNGSDARCHRSGRTCGTQARDINPARIRDPRTSLRRRQIGTVQCPFCSDTPEMRRRRFDCSRPVAPAHSTTLSLSRERSLLWAGSPSTLCGRTGEGKKVCPRQGAHKHRGCNGNKSSEWFTRSPGWGTQRSTTRTRRVDLCGLRQQRWSGGDETEIADARSERKTAPVLTLLPLLSRFDEKDFFSGFRVSHRRR